MSNSPTLSFNLTFLSDGTSTSLVADLTTGVGVIGQAAGGPVANPREAAGIQNVTVNNQPAASASLTKGVLTVTIGSGAVVPAGSSYSVNGLMTF